MRDGFIKVAACTPEIRVADTEYNSERIIKQLFMCREKGVKVAVFPELCVTGYTCQDLFFQDTMLDAAEKAAMKIAGATEGLNMLTAFGCPVRARGKLYNCAVVAFDGEIVLIVPKTHLPNYNEYYEARYFAPHKGKSTDLEELVGKFGIDDECMRIAEMSQGIVTFDDCPELKVGFEICEDLWVADPVSNHLAQNGATLICNLSASNEVIGKERYRRELVSNQSARLICGYVYCSAGNGESTQDMVFSGHNIIAENGAILAESRLFENGITVSEIDVMRLAFDRRKMSTYPESKLYWDAGVSEFGEYNVGNLGIRKTTLTRKISKTPFIPSDKEERDYRCGLILRMQAEGLKKRLEHTNAKKAVVGISGGLDSSLALLVMVKAIDLLNRSHKDILAVTMPCFGTTERTKSNAVRLCEALGVSLETVDITKSVRQHFEDIGHDESVHDVVYENGQARERTKVLMDIANREGGLVVGTGDLSELALGWATYNGDHMSMYGVNASVPKTLVRHIVKYYADTCGYKPIAEVLYDILDTPVSPELLPANGDGEISQKTEDLVGPYELHDFFLYCAVRFGFPPKKIKRLCMYAFGSEYSEKTVTKWLKVFYRRFFSQQFKRSCLPDGAKIGSVTLSPRGDLRMPSDAVAAEWLKEID